MPRTRITNSRICKDLSDSNVQLKIGFSRKKTSKIVEELRVKSPDLKKKSEFNAHDKSGQDSKCTYPGKRLKKPVNDENYCSPIKSPRKVVGKCIKTPLADLTNSPTNNDSYANVISEIGEPARRKLSLVTKQEATSYTKLCQVLHNSIPKELVSREKELKVLNKFFDSCVLKSKPGSLYICGAPGTGKTACLTKVLDENKGSKFKTIFLNCMSVRHSQSIFSRLATLVDNTGKSYSNQEGTKYLEKKLTAGGQRILLVLDEIDQLESKDQEVLYKLFELPFLPKSRLVLIGIANSLDFTDRILPRLQTKISCKPILLQFQPYKKDEICAILEGRIKETNNDIVDKSAVQLCARKVSAITGDARKALDILRRAVEIAEGQSKMTVSPIKKDSSLTKVTIVHVASVCSDIYGARLAGCDVKFVFPLQQKVIICTIVSCLKHAKIKEIAVSKLYASYCKVSKCRHIATVGQEEFNGICDLLESQGILSIKKAKDVQNNKISLRMQESELEHALQDKSLMLSILSSTIPC